MSEVVCLGIMVADLVARSVGCYPDKGKLSLVEEMKLHTGGCAVNTAITLSKLGIKTSVIGKVGKDALGDFMVTNLREAGVDSAGIRRDHEANTSSTMVLVDEDGERSFIHYVGANANFTSADVNWDLIQGARVLHIAGSLILPKFDGKPTAEVLKKAQQLGCLTSVDTVWDASGNWMELLKPCLPYIDIFLPSLAEAQEMAGLKEPEEISRVFLEAGVKVVAIKMGSSGCYVCNKQEEIRLPAFSVENVVDATGAGDAFVAGFLAGICKDLNLSETATLANAVGAQAVQAVGATAGIRNWEETQVFLKSNSKLIKNPF